MQTRRTDVVDGWSVWALPCMTIVSVAALTVSPAPLLPVARAFRDLCNRYPVLAILTNHLPPLPVALLGILVSIALVRAAAEGMARLMRTRRLMIWLNHQPCELPERLASVGRQLGAGDRVHFLDQPIVTAFCVGLIRPRIVVSAGILARLDDEELLAVLAHEYHHLRRRDPLRTLLLHTAAAATFMFPLSDFLRRRIEVHAELAADRAALAVSSPGALAGALLAVLDAREARVPDTVGLSATEARVAHLLGQRVLPEIPARAAIASLVPIIAPGLAVANLMSSSHFLQMACAFCTNAP